MGNVRRVYVEKKSRIMQYRQRICGMRSGDILELIPWKMYVCSSAMI